MVTSADKVSKHVTAVQKQSAQPFFARKHSDSFFGGGDKASAPTPFIQAKLSVSHPEDAQEKEADQMAHKVMTMPDTTHVAAASDQKEKLNRKEEQEEVQRTATDKQEEQVQKMEMPALQMKEEEEVQRAEENEIQRKEEQEDALQRAEEKKEEKVHAKLFAGSRNGSPGNFVQTKCEACDDDKKVSRKASAVPLSYTIQRSSRGPPGDTEGSGSFEQNLATTRGTGNALPGETQSFMESRFSADFSGVRVHTNETSVQMNKDIHAQAFTYGNDIYFNSGKYAPSSTEGKTLLAHELTHTIQQGASSHTARPAGTGAASVATKHISRKKSIQRSPANLATAVGFAKGEQGKVIANKEGPDGQRFGWQQLMDYFKTTLGPEKILPDGVAGDSTTVSEGNIKKRNTAKGVNIITPDGQLAKGDRDAMPSWCGIFAFWALNKAGLPMKKWLLGNLTIPPDAALAPGTAPPPGFIAYRNLRSHYGLVSSVAGSKVTTVNGNTAGADNLGGEIQEQTHDIANWTAFIDPMKLIDGTVRNPGTGVEGKPKSFRELQKEMFGVSRKEEDGKDSDGRESDGREKDGKEADGREIQAKKQDTQVQDPSNASEKGGQAENDELQRKDEGKEEKNIQKKELIHTSGDNAAPGQKEELQRKEEPGENEKSIQKEEMTHSSGDDAARKEELQRKEEGKEEDKAAQKKDMIHAAADSSPPAEEKLLRKEEGEEQDKAVQKKDMIHFAADSSPPKEEHEETAAVQRKSEPKVQRLFGWVSDAVEWVGDKLDEGKKWVLEKVTKLIVKVPGYKALRVVLGGDPITGEVVARNGHNFIDAAIDLMPGGTMLKEKLEELGIIDQAAKLVEKLFGRVEKLISGIYDTFANFMDSLSLSDLKDVPGVFRRLENAFTSFFDQVVDFAKGVAKDFLEFIKKALLIPLGTYIKTKTKFWDLLCLVIGKDPLTDEVKNPTGANILNAVLGISDWGIEQRKKMQETGTFNKVAAWIDKGIAVFGKAYDMLKAAFKGLWNMVSINSLMHPVDTFLKIFDSFWQPISLVGNFFLEAGLAILKIVKDVLFKWISEKGKETKGYYLMTVLISKDPFTGEKVPRTTENLIKGFMMLSEGGEEQFNKMKESGAIDKATAKIDAAVETLGFTWAYVKGLFSSLWERLGWKDLLVPVMAFVKIIDTFKNPILRLIRFIITVVVALFEVILRMMGFPVDLVFKLIDNVKKAWGMIKANPTGFLLNLLRAIKQGFTQFFDNILTHLWNGLKAWLKNELADAGVPIPTDYTAMGIIKWLLVVLDITMEKIWKKLETRIGKEKVDKIRSLIAKAEAIYDKANEAMAFIEDVRQRGMDAIVDKIKEKLTNIWDMVLDAIKSFIMDQIIKKVTAKLLSMLDPTGIMAVVNSAIALYKAIQSFFKQLARILEIVNSFVEGIIEICSGNITSAANFLERSLANGIPVVIGFLANQVGLDLSGRIREVLDTVREKVDQGLDFLIDKLVGFVEKLVAKVKEAKDAVLGWLGFKKPFTTKDGKSHSMYFEGEGENAKLIVKSTPKTLEQLAEDRKKELETENTATPAKAAENAPKLAALTQAASLKKGMEPDLKKYAEAVNKKSDTEGNALKDKINDKMNKILEQLIIAGVETEGSNNIETNVQHSLTSMGRPGSVTAFPLTKIPGNTAGSPPQEKPVGWDKIPASANPSTSWVGAHLLNHNLHGPGVSWNLVCGTKETNNNMKTEVENTAKKEVLGNPTKQYYFEAKVSYYDAQPTFPDAVFFPKKIDTEFGELSGEKGNFKKDKLIASRPFSQDTPSMTKTSMPSFNESTATRLWEASVTAKKALPQSVFSLIVDARRSTPTQTFGDSVANMIAVVDVHNVKANGKPAGAFSSSYGGVLTSLSQTDIFMNY